MECAVGRTVTVALLARVEDVDLVALANVAYGDGSTWSELRDSSSADSVKEQSSSTARGILGVRKSTVF